jgi:hypothetical protein
MRSIYLLSLAVLGTADAFQGIHVRPSSLAPRRQGTALFDQNEEEIAKLEEQLKNLRNQKVVVEDNPVAPVAPAVPAAAAASPEDEEEGGMEMFLTEQWKEEKGKRAAKKDESNRSGLILILGAVGAVLALVIFSQIPIGQEDLSKYSVGNNPPSRMIDLGDLNRARNAGDL